MFLSALQHNLHFNSCPTLYPCMNLSSTSVSHLNYIVPPSLKNNYICNNVRLNVSSKKSDLKPENSSNPVSSKKSDLKPENSSNPNFHSKPKAKPHHQKSIASQNEVKENSDDKIFPTTIPKKPRRGRRSEAAAVEDFMRDSLERTFASIRQQNSEVLTDKECIIKERIDDSVKSDDADDGNEENVRSKKTVIEEDNPEWPLDADVGWGIRASEYFEKHAIRNVVGEDGVEIDWEGEIDDSWVKEINCLEWEDFAFHPSPLIVLVFERYNRATDNWKALKELEKATKVYWRAKDRLPPRAVKIDINIERDMAYALKIKEGPQILFLRGNRILYREKQFRTSDELVQMIAHFYYKAKKPSCMIPIKDVK